MLRDGFEYITADDNLIFRTCYFCALYGKLNLAKNIEYEKSNNTKLCISNVPRCILSII